MQKWEYKVINLDYQNREAQLNELGQQGWELVAVENTATCFLKRQISN